MRLDIVFLDKRTDEFRKQIRKAVRRLEGFLSKNGFIEVYLISGERMAMLNAKFRKKKKATNVLSFKATANFPDSYLGEIYLDPFYIKKRDENLELVLIHGILHILGYSHKRKNDRIKMEKREERLLSML